MSLVKVFFRTFHQNKKSAKSFSHSSQRVPASVSHPRRAPQQRVRLNERVMVMNEHGLHYWNMGRVPNVAGGGEMANTSTLATTDYGDVVVGLGSWWRRLCLGAAGQSWRLLEEFHVLRGRRRAVRTRKSGFCLRPCCRCAGEWVLPVEYSVWIFRDACATWFNSGYMSTGGFGQLSAFSTIEVNSNPEAFFHHSVEWRRVHSGCFRLQFLQPSLHVETWTLFLQVLHFLAVCGGFFVAQCSWSPR